MFMIFFLIQTFLSSRFYIFKIPDANILLRGEQFLTRYFDKNNGGT